MIRFAIKPPDVVMMSGGTINQNYKDMSKIIKFPCLRVLEARIAELQREYFHVEVVKMYDNKCVVHLA